jgi:hypothetical protein
MNISTNIQRWLPATIGLACIALFSPPLAAQPDMPGAQRFEDDSLVMLVQTRTPEQLAAFYTGRGFNAEAIAAITQRCFVFGFIENKTYDAMWLVLDDWQFTDAGGQPIQRMRRSDWQPVWQQTGLKQAHQSTFGWTQLPESRDLRPHEHAGGHAVIPWQDGPFTLTVTLRSGADKSGTPRVLTFSNLRCEES